mmetsp:Transcript_78199/g.137768  ORF Transcript_78199/g.137768 Transcript_78199/m.137768 type:complete len:85 (+) Transcript_78199:28-282(+)
MLSKKDLRMRMVAMLALPVELQSHALHHLKLSTDPCHCPVRLLLDMMEVLVCMEGAPLTKPHILELLVRRKLPKIGATLHTMAR